GWRLSGRSLRSLQRPKRDSSIARLECCFERCGVVESPTHCGIPYVITHAVLECVGLSGRLKIGAAPLPWTACRLSSELSSSRCSSILPVGESAAAGGRSSSFFNRREKSTA